MLSKTPAGKFGRYMAFASNEYLYSTNVPFAQEDKTGKKAK